MKNILTLVFLAVISCKCKQTTTDKTAIDKNNVVKQTEQIASNCIVERITVFRKNTQCKTGSKVTSYLFQKQLVYVFEEGPCGADMTASVLDKDCNELGMLGGFIGNTKINGIPFSEAIFQEIIWKQKE